jgi:hypothetical protein
LKEDETGTGYVLDHKTEILYLIRLVLLHSDNDHRKNEHYGFSPVTRQHEYTRHFETEAFCLELVKQSTLGRMLEDGLLMYEMLILVSPLHDLLPLFCNLHRQGMFLMYQVC